MPERRPVDYSQRRKALDPRGSFIVQAPAGSGKTELLTQRILALLAQVERPEEVLAITFTRKAAAEMRSRLLRALQRAQDPEPPGSEHQRATWELARAALAQDRLHDWQLLRNPNRLQLVTIDSFCSQLIRRMPWLSRYGAPPAVGDNPHEDYRAAAERLLLQGVSGSAARKPVAVLLRHLDNRMDVLRDMLVAMLARRDQWLRYLLDQRHEQSRALLEGSLRRFVEGELHRLDLLLDEPFKAELLELAGYAGGNLLGTEPGHPLALLADCRRFPTPEASELGAWLALCELLLTQSGGVRARVNKNQGFPADKSELAQQMKHRMAELLEGLRADSARVAALLCLRNLPHVAYYDHQWRVLDALVDLLPLVAAELEQVFREQGRIDFIAIASGARVALGESEAPEELLLQLDSRISHILVDEFQDTSYGQFALLEKLVAGWIPGDGRTLFLVGDPMQSIYRFREAEVGLFLRARQRGIADVSLEPLQLSTNFRSRANVVAWFNRVFSRMFPEREDEALGAVCFAPSGAADLTADDEATRLSILRERDDRQEAALICEQIGRRRAADPGATHAVLVRSRAHAHQVVVRLRAAGIPFQAQELDPLDTRQPVFDLLSLTRALVHPGDRLAWLSVLRAPWCGLRLESLLTLCDGDRYTPLWILLQEPARLNWLPDGERQRLERCREVLAQSLARRGREPLSRLVYTAWLALGGPATCSVEDCADVRRYLQLLDDAEQAGDLVSFEALDQSLATLYAATDVTPGSEMVQVMTIHKAKGLEFDHVYLPGLGRSVRPMGKELLRWLEHPDYGLLLAPVPSSSSSGEDSTYSAIGSLLAAKDAFETVRLLYVACTRARRSLHLFGHLGGSDDDLCAPSNSLLQVAWESLAVTADDLVDACSEAADDAADEFPGRLRRLSAAWSLPDFTDLPRAAESLHHAATRQARDFDSHHFAAGEARRLAGTVVHLWLERVARQGLEAWPLERLDGLQARILRHLTTLGCPGQQVVSAGRLVHECLLGALTGKHGRWVLQGHDEAECEVALSAELDGVRIEAVVDRTFLLEDGVRWIVDYKTSAPSGDESREEFLQRELDGYRSQLSTYLQIFELLEPGRPVTGALYFPRLDVLQVLEL